MKGIGGTDASGFEDSRGQGLMLEVVTPVKTGVQIICKPLKSLDSGFCRNDGKTKNQTIYDIINC